jgi:hypothetical protein
MRAGRLPLALAILALAVSATLPAHAASSAPRHREEPRMLRISFDFLRHIPRVLVSLWQKEGSAVDPFGGRGSTPPPPNTGGLTAPPSFDTKPVSPLQGG